jgi:hypothetical protein
MTKASAQRAQRRGRTIEKTRSANRTHGGFLWNHRGDLLTKGDVLEQELPPRTTD